MEETDYQGPTRDLEEGASEMQERRDGLERETEEARQDVRSKVSDQRVPGIQDEQEDVLEGREAVEERQEQEGGEEGDESEDEETEGDGSEGAGYREEE
jgi:hypothetical protein